MFFREFFRRWRNELSWAYILGSIFVLVLSLISVPGVFSIAWVCYISLPLGLLGVGICTGCAYYRSPFLFFSDRSLLAMWLVFIGLNLCSVLISFGTLLAASFTFWLVTIILTVAITAGIGLTIAYLMTQSVRACVEGCLMAVLDLHLDPNVAPAPVHALAPAPVPVLAPIPVPVPVLAPIPVLVHAPVPNQNVNLQPLAEEALRKNLSDCYESAKALDEKEKEERAPLLTEEEREQYEWYLKNLKDADVRHSHFKECTECPISQGSYTGKIEEKAPVTLTVIEEGTSRQYTLSYSALDQRFQKNDFRNPLTGEPLNENVTFSYGVSEKIKQEITDIRAELKAIRSNDSPLEIEYKSSNNRSNAELKLASALISSSAILQSERESLLGQDSDKKRTDSSSTNEFESGIPVELLPLSKTSS